MLSISTLEKEIEKKHSNVLYLSLQRPLRLIWLNITCKMISALRKGVANENFVDNNFSCCVFTVHCGDNNFSGCVFTVETITPVVVCSLWSGQAATVNETRRPTSPGLEFPPTLRFTISSSNYCTSSEHCLVLAQPTTFLRSKLCLGFVQPKPILSSG